MVTIVAKRPRDVPKALSPRKHSTVRLRCFGSMGMKESTWIGSRAP